MGSAKRPLAGKVAVVAGATRGAGRGIARMLGEAGAIVYCTGRSSRRVARPRVGRRGSPFDLSRRPETIEQTAELVDAAGGTGIAVRVDHTDERQVRRLFARVRAEHGRLDLLVDDVWGGDALAEWGKPFWEQSADKSRALLAAAVHSHLITCRHAAPLMIERRRGLIVEVTDGDSLAYRGNLPYDLVKVAVIRLAFAMSEELRPHRVAAVAVTPGFLRSEAMLEHIGVTEEDWRDGARVDPHFAHSETPCFVGRGIAALAADPKVLARSGQVLASWTLGREYGLVDVDGRRPDWGRHADREAFGREQRDSEQRFLRGAAVRHRP